MEKVKVIDTIMGQGKTTWAINYMINNPQKRFIFITPFLEEVTRVKKAIPNMYEPSIRNRRGGGKLNSLKDLVFLGKNIVTTHALMSRFDREVIEYLKIGDYVLILDEVTEVLEQFDFITKANEKLFFEALGYVDNDKYVRWKKDAVYTPENCVKEDFFSEMAPLCTNKQLVQIGTNHISYIKEFPVEIFKGFTDVFLLTYLFEGSVQKPYFDTLGIEYEYLSVENGELVQYKPTSRETKQELKSLINIVDSEKMNMIGESDNAFSSSWCKKNLVRGSTFTQQLSANTNNFLRNMCGGGIEHHMVATFKGEDTTDYFNLIRMKGWIDRRKVFVPYNKKATNEYIKKYNLAYLVNIYPHTALTMYFNEKGLIKDGERIKINERAYALSILIQWIWRSRIRDQSLPFDQRKINLYLPSRRMREILIEWLDSE